MKHFKRTALAGVINLALFGIPDAHAADTQALERRIRELESRLEKLDQAGALSNKPVVTPTPEVEKLTRKVNTLERKLEVQDEVTAGAFQKLPVFDAGADGFKITSSDKKHQVRIRGSVQGDGRFYLDDTTGRAIDKFEVKQARVWLEGYFFKDIYFKIMPDFAAGSNILPDAYIDYAYHPWANLLVGKFKPSISLERLQGDSDGTFLERAFPTYLAPNRDVGVQLHGAFSLPGYKPETVAGPIDTRNTFTYQVGVTNGSGDDGSPNNNSPDTDNNKELVGRLFAHPFQHSGYSWLEGLGLGVAGTLGNPDRQALKAQATPLGRTTYLDYTKLNAGFAAPTSDGPTYRVYPQAYWFAGPFGAIGEYVISSQHLVSGRTNVQQKNTAWQFLASYVVTGEDNSFNGVKPIQNFDPLKGNWGALQLAARYSELDVDNNTFLIVDPNQSASKARAWTIGANWFLNSNAVIRADYENVAFEGGAARGRDLANESIFATRFQLAF
ncbi:MAG: porin [Methylobacter sp.]